MCPSDEHVISEDRRITIDRRAVRSAPAARISVEVWDWREEARKTAGAAEREAMEFLPSANLRDRCLHDLKQERNEKAVHYGIAESGFSMILLPQPLSQTSLSICIADEAFSLAVYNASVDGMG